MREPDDFDVRPSPAMTRRAGRDAMFLVADALTTLEPEAPPSSSPRRSAFRHVRVRLRRPRRRADVGCSPSAEDEFRQAAIYVDRIFKGAKPADLPAVQPTNTTSPVNMRDGGDALGLTIPPSVLLRADDVVQYHGSADQSDRSPVRARRRAAGRGPRRARADARARPRLGRPTPRGARAARSSAQALARAHPGGPPRRGRRAQRLVDLRLGHGTRTPGTAARRSAGAGGPPRSAAAPRPGRSRPPPGARPAPRRPAASQARAASSGDTLTAG